MGGALQPPLNRVDRVGRIRVEGDPRPKGEFVRSHQGTPRLRYPGDRSRFASTLVRYSGGTG
jgi:hypothetical protein